MTLKLLFKIVVIVTVLFLNLFLPLNVVIHWYLDSLYVCLGVHMLCIHCLIAKAEHGHCQESVQAVDLAKVWRGGRGSCHGWYCEVG